jgi:hypothetical protein
MLSGTNLFACTTEGVFLSENNGTNWTILNSGWPEHAGVGCLAASGPDLYAGTGGDVWRLQLSDIVLKNK